MSKIDGQPLQAQQIHSWRQSVAYVPQETFLFHDTVRANLLWTRPQASDEELWQILRLAAAEQFVAELPDNLETSHWHAPYYVIPHFYYLMKQPVPLIMKMNDAFN
jgi:ABC-type multidrug transport system fused ATPase/permease subunit